MSGVVQVSDVQRRGERQPRAALLAAVRAKQGLVYVAEPVLVRDVLYLLQGISGEHVRLSAAPAAAAALELHFDERHGRIPAPARDLLHRIAELGQLCVRLQRYVDEHTHPVPRHRAAQSLSHYVSRELRAHAAWASALDAQWHAQDEAPGSAPPLTLQRLACEAWEPLLRLRLLSTMVESCRPQHGGALVSTIHAYTLTGDPLIRRWTADLLEHVSRPFFHTLSRWLYDGELEDPFDEFFVARTAPPPARARPVDDLVVLSEPGFDAAAVWQSRFALRREQLPSFLSEHFARRIFSTGKSLHFLRECCHDAGARPPHAALRELKYSDMPGLEHAINHEFAQASGRLCTLLLTQFRLRDHLCALKRYVLLEQGDFADALLDTLAPSLARPAASLYQHNLSAALETAIRASGAQFDDPAILACLDARSLEFGAGDTGWDTFTLEYRVESPLNAVLDASAMAGYQLLFHYLWQIQRVAAAATRAWAQLRGAERAVLRARARTSHTPALAAGLRRALLQVRDMVHFVRQLQGFCELEGLAHAWQRLEHDLAAPISDLDQLIDTHRHYLGSLINTTLLRGRRGHADGLADDVRAQLHTILDFARAAETLAHHTTADLARAAAGVDAPPGAQRTIDAAHTALRTEHAVFQQRLLTMLGALERHPTLAVRDLAVRASDSHTAPLGL